MQCLSTLQAWTYLTSLPQGMPVVLEESTSQGGNQLLTNGHQELVDKQPNSLIPKCMEDISDARTIG